MQKTDIVIRIWPVSAGYQWLVPRNDDERNPPQFSGDIGTAVRAAHAVAESIYGNRLGIVDFRLNTGL